MPKRPNYAWILVAKETVTRSNLYPLLHKNLSHPSPSPNPSARTDSPRKTAWERDSTQNSALQKDSIQCAVGANMLVCYLPYQTVAFTYSISRQVTQALRDAVAVTLSLLLCNSSLNPFLYCWKIREVKQAVKETVRQFWCFSRQL